MPLSMSVDVIEGSHTHSYKFNSGFCLKPRLRVVTTYARFVTINVDKALVVSSADEDRTDNKAVWSRT
jgi:hypothetical protein